MTTKHNKVWTKTKSLGVDFIGHVKKNPYQYVIFAVYFLVVLILQIYYYAPLEQLPSPIYGGDYYYQLGSVEHIKNGGGWFESSSLVDALPTYLPLYSVLIAILSTVLFVSSLKAMLIGSVIFAALSVLLWYFVWYRIFENTWIALLGTCMVNLLGIEILKYTPFSHYIIFPLFIWALYEVFSKQRFANFVWLAIIYGLLVFNHMVIFMGATLMIFFFGVYHLWSQKQDVLGYVKKFWKCWAIFCLIAFVICLAYWWQPLFVHHLDMSHYERSRMDFPDFSQFSIQWDHFSATMKRFLFSGGPPYRILLSFLTVVALLGSLVVKLKHKKHRVPKNFVLFFTIGSFLASFSYFLTEPLLDMNLIPTYMSGFYLWVSQIMLVLLLVYVLYIYVNKEWVIMLSVAVLLLLLIVMASQGYVKNIEGRQFYQVAKQPLSDHYLSLQEYLQQNTQVDDVILTTKEVGFAVNSLAGNKLISGRWAHNGDPYTNIPLRDAHSAAMLYGDNVSLTKQLIEEYGVDYLYWDYYWIRSEFVFNDQGQVIGMYDPFMPLDQPKYREIFAAANVSYQAMNFWLDPAIRTPQIRMFDILVVGIDNYRSAEKPYSAVLDPYLEEVWRYEDAAGNTYGILYAINTA